MSGGLFKLASKYDAVLNKENVSVTELEEVLTEQYADREECLLQLSLIRKLFTESVLTPSHLDYDTNESVHTCTSQDSVSSNETADICERLLKNNTFLSTLVNMQVLYLASNLIVIARARKIEVTCNQLVSYLTSSEQLVCFTASKALVAVLGTKKHSALLEIATLNPLIANILTIVSEENLANKKSIYCLQLFGNLLKQLRKPLASDHPSLSCSLSVLQSHWPRVLNLFKGTHKSLFENVQIHSQRTDGQYPATEGTYPLQYFGVNFVLSLGEFLSLTVEVLRYYELALKGKKLFLEEDSDQLLYFKITESAGILTSLVNYCAPKQLYLLKRLLDVFLKLNFFLLQSASNFVLFSSPLSSSQPTTALAAPPQNSLSLSPTSHHHTTTASQVSPPHKSISLLTTHHLLYSSSKNLPQTIDVTNTHTRAPILCTNQARLSSHQPTISKSTLDSTLPPTNGKPSSSEHGSNPNLTLHCCILSLLQNKALSEACQHWLKRFMKIAGVNAESATQANDGPAARVNAGSAEWTEEEPYEIADGLKCTVSRKACLLVIEYVAGLIARDSKSDLTILLLRVESLLGSIVSWSRGSVPPSLVVTVEGLLADEVESTGVDFLRLLFYSILTEQDDCLVRALLACVSVHNSLHKEYDNLKVETPLLHLFLGVFNVHTLFIKFLSGTGFDSTLLLDFIMSPETHFSFFFVQYLEIVIRDKWTSTAFNYDLQSACAEMDIVDEYMDMDLSGSEDEENEVNPEVQQPGTQLKSANEHFMDDIDGQIKRGVVSTDSTVNEHTAHSQPSSQSNEAIATVASSLGSRKRDHKSPFDEAPVAKRTSTKQFPVECDSICALKSLESPTKEISQPVPDLPEEHELSDEPPPTQTFVRVLSCLVDLGEKLSKLCAKELLSRWTNNVDKIVSQTEQLKDLYPNISFM